MRLKAFSAPTMALAMAEVRASLGKEAIIVSSRAGGREGGVTVMAAVETPAPDTLAASPPEDRRYDDPLDAVDEILAFHRVPSTTSDMLLTAARSFDADSAISLLAAALDTRFRFRDPLPGTANGTVVLFGPAGAGKTVAAAKIAAAGLLAGRPVRLVNADSLRPGGGARLKALAERLEIPIEDTADRSALQQYLAASRMEMTIVDTPGINPFDNGEVDGLRSLLAGVDAARLLVLAAGGDALEAMDQALAFGALGADALVVTRLDVAMRYGNALAAAEACGLPFAGAGVQPQIGDGLTHLNPMSLARILAARHSEREFPLTRPEHAA